MKNQFILAYKDVNGKDFNGLPWLENFGNDINDLKSFLKNCKHITNPIVFQCTKEELPQWYVHSANSVAKENIENLLINFKNNYYGKI